MQWRGPRLCGLAPVGAWRSCSLRATVPADAQADTDRDFRRNSTRLWAEPPWRDFKGQRAH